MPMVLTVQMVKPDLPDLKDHRDLLARPDRPAHRDLPELMAQMARMVNPETVAEGDCRAKRVTPATKETRAIKAIKETRVIPDRLDQAGMVKERRATQDLPDPMAPPDLKDLPEPMEPQAKPAQEDLLAPEGLPDSPDLKAWGETLDRQDHLAQMEPQEQKVIPEIKAIKVTKGIRVTRAIREIPEPKDHKEFKDPKDLPDRAGTGAEAKERRVIPDHRESKERKVNPEPKESKDLQGLMEPRVKGDLLASEGLPGLKVWVETQDRQDHPVRMEPQERRAIPETKATPEIPAPVDSREFKDLQE